MNNKILKQRWEKVDELLSTFYSNNQKINKRMFNNIQDILDGIKFSYEELNDYVRNSQIARLRSKIEDIKDQYGLEGYIGFELSNYAKRKKLRNRELLLALLMIEYYKQYQEQNKAEEKLFDEVIKMTYESVSEETEKVLARKRGRRRHFKHRRRFLTVPEAFLLQLIGMSSFNGFKWLEYKQGTLGYNVSRLYEGIISQVQRGTGLYLSSPDIKRILDRQIKLYFTKRKEKPLEYDEYRDEFFGALDNQVSYIVNQTALRAMKDMGCEKVEFVAIMDSSTTKMCESLDGKIFLIDGLNVYTRYSDEEKKEKTYSTIGLVSGVNLPPIMDHYHYCRSTIYPFE